MQVFVQGRLHYLYVRCTMYDVHVFYSYIHTIDY